MTSLGPIASLSCGYDAPSTSSRIELASLKGSNALEVHDGSSDNPKQLTQHEAFERLHRALDALPLRCSIPRWRHTELWDPSDLIVSEVTDPSEVSNDIVGYSSASNGAGNAVGSERKSNSNHCSLESIFCNTDELVFHELFMMEDRTPSTDSVIGALDPDGSVGSDDEIACLPFSLPAENQRHRSNHIQNQPRQDVPARQTHHRSCRDRKPKYCLSYPGRGQAKPVSRGGRRTRQAEDQDKDFNVEARASGESSSDHSEHEDLGPLFRRELRPKERRLPDLLSQESEGAHENYGFGLWIQYSQANALQSNPQALEAENLKPTAALPIPKKERRPRTKGKTRPRPPPASAPALAPRLVTGPAREDASALPSAPLSSCAFASTPEVAAPGIAFGFAASGAATATAAEAASGGSRGRLAKDSVNESFREGKKANGGQQATPSKKKSPAGRTPERRGEEKEIVEEIVEVSEGTGDDSRPISRQTGPLQNPDSLSPYSVLTDASCSVQATPYRRGGLVSAERRPRSTRKRAFDRTLPSETLTHSEDTPSGKCCRLTHRSQTSLDAEARVEKDLQEGNHECGNKNDGQTEREMERQKELYKKQGILRADSTDRPPHLPQAIAATHTHPHAHPHAHPHTHPHAPPQAHAHPHTYPHTYSHTHGHTQPQAYGYVSPPAESQQTAWPRIMRAPHGGLSHPSLAVVSSRPVHQGHYPLANGGNVGGPARATSAFGPEPAILSHRPDAAVSDAPSCASPYVGVDPMRWATDITHTMVRFHRQGLFGNIPSLRTDTPTSSQPQSQEKETSSNDLNSRPEGYDKLDFTQTPITGKLLRSGFDLRLGEKGRCLLKQIISQRNRESNRCREMCSRVARLKSANIYQLIQLAEVCGALEAALMISNNYWNSVRSAKGRKAPTPPTIMSLPQAITTQPSIAKRRPQNHKPSDPSEKCANSHSCGRSSDPSEPAELDKNNASTIIKPTALTKPPFANSLTAPQVAPPAILRPPASHHISSLMYPSSASSGYPLVPGYTANQFPPPQILAVPTAKRPSFLDVTSQARSSRQVPSQSTSWQQPS